MHIWIGYAHADSLLTYPRGDNLSTSSQPIRIEAARSVLPTGVRAGPELVARYRTKRSARPRIMRGRAVSHRMYGVQANASDTWKASATKQQQASARNVRKVSSYKRRKQHYGRKQFKRRTLTSSRA